MSTERRGLGRGIRAAGLLALGLALAGSGAGVAHAATGDCTTMGSQVTCTYTYTGAVQTFTTPAGVTSVTVDAIGGPGGSSFNGGGFGADVSATISGLTSSVTTLFVYVGGAGGAPIYGSGGSFNGVGGAAGFNGGGVGGSSYFGGGGGGGASDIRTTSNDLTTRLIVAGGGGGGGGGDGGDGGGTAGIGVVAGGGAAGSLGTGGDGGSSRSGSGGGGGGGGFYGGAGGVGNGGGGGSNLTAATVNGVTSSPFGNPRIDTTKTPEVIITYTQPAVGGAGGGGTCATTPELGSGELLATGLFPLGAVLLYRRRRTRRATQQ